MFNTHLDVWSSEARLRQARMVADHVREWAARWPHAAIFLTGDFNTANGHRPHQVLVSDPPVLLNDAWDACVDAGSGACYSNGMAATFHGWLGPKVNTYAARLVQYALQTVHDAGIDFPKHVPRSTREALREMRALVRRIWAHGWTNLKQSMPASISRIHVDWILTGASHSPNRASCKPKVMAVAEIRDQHFSSDHFPVIGAFLCTFRE